MRYNKVIVDDEDEEMPEIDKNADEFLNIDYDAARRQPKEKKEKPYRYLLYQMGKRRKKKNEPSEIQKITNDLIKKKINTAEGVRNYLVEKRIKVSDKQKRLYEYIASSKIINGNITLSDTLTNRPIYIYHYMYNFNTRTFTNDSLYIATLVYKQAGYESEMMKTIINKCVEVDYIQIVSNSFECDGNIAKGYYQDYSGNFAAIGLSIANAEIQNKILDLKEKIFTFNYLNSNYIACGNGDSCIVVLASEKDKIRQYYNNMKIIHTTGKVELNEKTYDMHKKIKYIDSKLKPDSFCPAYMILPKAVKCSMMVKFKYDYNKLLQTLDELYEQSNKESLVTPANMVYWDDINEAFDFLGIYGLTSRKLTDQHKIAVTNFYDEYLKYKPVIMLWKENQLLSQRILIEFYNSFSSKIQFDKLNHLLEKTELYIKNRKTLELDETYNAIKDLFNRLNVASSFINNQFRNEYLLIFQKIQKLVYTLVNEWFEPGKLTNELFKLGMAIFDLTALGRSKDKVVYIPYLLSPGAFFGDVTSQSDIKNIEILKSYIIEYEEDRARKLEKQGDETNRITTFATEIDDHLFEITFNTIKEISKVNNWEFDDEYLKKMTNSIVNDFLLNKQFKKTYKRVVSDLYDQYMINGTFDGMLFPFDQISTFIDIYIEHYNKEAQKQNLQNQRKDIDNKIEAIRNIQSNQENDNNIILEPVVNESMGNSNIPSKNVDNGVYTIYQTNKIFKDAMQRFRDNQYIQRKLKAYWLDLARLSGLYKNSISTVEKLYDIMDGELSIGDILTKYKLDDDIISHIIYSFDLPNIITVLTQPSYALKVNSEPDQYGFSKERLSRYLQLNSINPTYSDATLDTFVKEVSTKPMVAARKKMIALDKNKKYKSKLGNKSRIRGKYGKK